MMLSITLTISNGIRGEKDREKNVSFSIIIFDIMLCDTVE